MHIMIDLETMGTRPDAPIVAIGAVRFDRQILGEEFYVNINLKSAIDAGANIDPSTVAWWLKQSREAQDALDLAEGISIASALDRFRSFCRSDDEIAGVWGNGATFDNVLLSEAYKRLGTDAPWPFWADRCYRTMKSEFPDVPLVRRGTHHNALDDAKTQAAHMQSIWRHIHGH